jgi:mono/diheme cytochrome c family protein
MTPPRASLLAASAALTLVACSSGSKGPAPSATASASASVAAIPSASSTAGAEDAARCALRAPRRIERAAAPGASSSVELVRAGGRLVALVADNDERALHAVDAESMKEIGVTPLPGRPGHVLALADGRVAVALRDTGKVMVLEPADDALARPFEERCAAGAAVEPWALAETGGKLLVASGFGAALTVLRAADLGAPRTLKLTREPRAVLVANGGKTAFVSHAVGGVVSAIDLQDLDRPPEMISLLAGRRANKDGSFDSKRSRQASQGYALASVIGPRPGGERDALRLFAPHTSVDPGATDHGPSIGYGSSPGLLGVAPIVSVLDPIARKSITNDVLFASGESSVGCVLPRSAVADADSLFVACMDIDAVIDLDPGLPDPMASQRRRIAVPAGPSALSLAEGGKQLFVWSEIDRALSRVEREGAAVTSVPLWRRAGEARDARVDRGRRLFHTSRDVRLTSGRACANCHPEGRDDGLVWTSPDGLRQTPILAGRLAGTAPYGWFGESPTVKEHLKKTFERLGGTGLDHPSGAEDFEALLAYLGSLPPPPTAPPADAKSAARGKAAFASYCNECHKNGGTDGQSHDVGTAAAGERRKGFDTPALSGVRGSAPYFHDGRYGTLEEILAARDQRMFIGTISEPDQRDLLAYLETL